MFDFLKKSKPQLRLTPRPVIKIIERELGSLTLADWRQDRVLCAQAGSALSSPLIRQMLQVLHNSHPAFQVLVRGDMNERAMQQARSEGYTLALADFESMGTMQAGNEPVETGFEQEEISQEEIAPFKADGKRSA